MTRKQKIAFDYVKAFITERGYSPTYEEVKTALNLKSKGAAFGIIKRLTASGRLIRDASHKITLGDGHCPNCGQPLAHDTWGRAA